MSIASYLSQLLNSSGLVPVAKINATGSPGATNYLRGDGSWQTLTQAQVYSNMFVGFTGTGAISGTTWTIKKVDGSTTAATITLDSSSTPTSKTRAT